MTVTTFIFLPHPYGELSILCKDVFHEIYFISFYQLRWFLNCWSDLQMHIAMGLRWVLLLEYRKVEWKDTSRKGPLGRGFPWASFELVNYISRELQGFPGQVAGKYFISGHSVPSFFSVFSIGNYLVNCLILGAGKHNTCFHI
jgi:hypothetical protein